MMRTNSRSALDFMYWILESVEENYLQGDSTAVYQLGSDTDLMHTTIVDMALICGVEVPRTFSALLKKVDRYDTRIEPQEALRRRGAVLYKGKSLHVSVGDRRRAVGVDIDGSVSIYPFGIMENAPEYWDGAFEIPEMVYL